MGLVRSSLAWVVLAGCYSPEFKPGAPCSSDSDCPSVQRCVAGTCGGGGTEPGVDGSTGDVVDSESSETDLDGDGLVGNADNCPTAANADQGNEDGDAFGDACDPCPIEASDTPSDPDGDGVADGCDPMPTTAGNQILLFEGFHGTLPTGWMLASATIVGDDLKFTASGNNQAFVSPPLDAPSKVTVSTRVVINQTTGNDDADFGVSANYNPGNDDGVRCELYSPTATSTTDRDVSIWDSIKSMTLGSNAFAWVTGTPYLVSMDRAGTNYACRASTVGGSPVTTSGGTTSVASQQKFGLRAYAATVSISYVLIVTNP